MDADTNNGTNEKIDTKVEPVVKKDESKLSSNTLNDKFSLDLLTPKFAHKLLEKSNVVTPKLDDAEKARKNEENRAKSETFTLPNSNLKYRYTEGQWSPINQDGAKRYDRDFLMQLQYAAKSKVRPENIFPDILRSEILPLIGNFLRQSMNFDSGFLKNTSQRGGRGSQQGRTPMKPSNSMGKPNVIHVSLKREDVKLNESDNAWKPTRRNAANATEDETKTQELYKNVRAILNKLTPQKFEALLGQIKGLDIGNQERLEGVIDLVFEKAIDEPNFCVAYASMCKELALMQVPANNPTKEQQFVNFRSLIVRRCQERFQKTEEEEKRILKERDEMVGDDEVKLRFLEEESRKIRWKSVGNIRFIGELYKHNMLTTKIMNHCIQTLVSDTDEQKLECLCKLLTTIGKELEQATKLEQYFKIMKDMVDRKINKGLSSRVRFMLQDVIDLRAHNWVTKHKDAPRTMDEIQKEAEAEQRHIQIMNAAPPPRKEDNRNLKRGGRSASTNAIDNNDWQTPRSSSHRFTVDSSKLKTININSNVDNVKLGPANMMSWNRGSGAKTSSLRQANPTPSTPLNNMYGLLANMNNDNGPPIRNEMYSANKNTESNLKENSNERPAYKNASTPAPTIARSAPTPAPLKQAEPEQMAPEKVKLLIMANIEEYFSMNNLKEVAMDVTQRVNSKDHAVMVAEIFNIVFEKPEKLHDKISNVLSYLVSSKTVSKENFLAGLTEILSYGPDLQIDIPMVYSYIATLITPIVVQNGFSLRQVFDSSKPILEANHGGRLLSPILRRIIDNWGKNFTKSKWIESGLTLQQWLNPDQVESFVKDNKLEFLEGDIKFDTNVSKLPLDVVQKKLKELMLMDQSADSIYGWIDEFVGENVKENQFIRALVQSICEQAISTSGLNQDRLGKYAPILIKYKEQKCELDCLLAIQHLVHRLEHPRGVSLELFQYFYGEHIFSPESFTEWAKTDLELEGKAVMLKALVSFFTQISECDDDSGSED